MSLADAALVVDQRGARCPTPVIVLAQRLVEVPVGAILAVVADDPGAAADIPAWCRMREQEYVGADADADGTPAFLVRRTS